MIIFAILVCRRSTEEEFESPFNLFFQVLSKTSEEDLRFAAENAKLVRAANVVIGGLPSEKLQFLKNINPELYISTYHSLIEIKLSDPLLDNGFYDEHEDWFLHCDEDPIERVRFSPDKYNNYLADISNQEYRDFWINRTNEAIANDPIDVIFIDCASAKHPSEHFSCTPENYSDDNWEQWVGQFLQEIKNAFSNKIVVSNSIKPGHKDDGEKFVGLGYADFVDGLSAETWVHLYGDYKGEEYWKWLLNEYILVLKQGTWIAVVQHPEKFADNIDQRRMFGFASYLLIKSEYFGFSEEDDPAESEQILKHPIFYVPIGEPEEELENTVDDYLADGVYVREYENGLVLVNPSESETKAYTLQEDMSLVTLQDETIEYTTVNEISLPSISGVILILAR